MIIARKNDLYLSSVEKAFRPIGAYDRNAAERALSEPAQVTSLALPNVQRRTRLSRCG